jgi:ubiquinone biosynthesis protein
MFAGYPRQFYKRLMYGEHLPSTSENAMEQLQDVIRAGGASTIKLGQFIASAKGLLPDDVVESFSWCRDQVPAMDFLTISTIIQEELNLKISEVFKEISREPIAAASIAQVHTAVLKNGQEVVVKVQRRGLKRSFMKDLRAMALIAFLAEKKFDVAKQANLAGFVELFANLVMQELDFRLEALNMLELGLAAEHAGVNFVDFPRPIVNMVRRKVLVMERLKGKPYNNLQWDTLPKESRRRLVQLVISGVLEHTLVYGVFHGDLHAGNVLAEENGRLGLIDFGIVGRIDLAQRASLVRFMIGIGMNSFSVELNALKDFGAFDEGVDIDQLAKELEDEVKLSDDIHYTDIADQVGEVVRFLMKRQVKLPSALILFFKNLLYLNSFIASVDPEINLMAEIAPIFEYFRAKYPDQMKILSGDIL